MSAHGPPFSRFPSMSRGTVRHTEQVYMTGNGFQQDPGETYIQQYQQRSGTVGAKSQGSPELQLCVSAVAERVSFRADFRQTGAEEVT